MSETITPDVCIDITSEVCPMTTVRARLALDRMEPGQVLAIMLRGEEPLRSVPANAARQGHAILSQSTDAAGVTYLLVRKRSPAPAT